MCFIYFIRLMSTTDLMDITALSTENVAIDDSQHVDAPTEEDQTQKEQPEQYQFDVIVIGSGPGGGYVH